jgi:phosphoribosylaminoimidazolecarboxamide formyltransferase / IMP cyclohydrolase
MEGHKKIRSALVSVFNKDGLDKIAQHLNNMGVTFYSTGGTRSYLTNLGIDVIAVEDITDYPSILGGRVKTLHPRIFGGILGRRAERDDVAQLEEFDIPEIDLVIVDLYPFEETLRSGADETEIIEKIDIGGVSLIRAGAKNFQDVLIIPSKNEYADLLKILTEQSGSSTLSQRKQLAGKAFKLTAAYDKAIAGWFTNVTERSLRYGENPHQKGSFIGNLEEVVSQLHGKELSYNNLLDIDAALRLVHDFPASGCAVIKHNNACGAAIDEDQLLAWQKALAGDPVSAFGGIIVFNTTLEAATAEAVDQLFFEIILAPGYAPEALQILQKKKNRMILQTKPFIWPSEQYRSVLNGLLRQDADLQSEQPGEFRYATKEHPGKSQLDDLAFALVLVKHTRSNAIVLVKHKQLLASGTGQTSRVDALQQAIEKARRMGFEPQGSVMASDAFFPFPDCVEIASMAGIAAIAQPGGSVRDQDSIDAANKLQIPMIITGTRHFKH